MANGPVTPTEALAGVITRKPWEEADTDRHWKCPEHDFEYGSNVPDRDGRTTWECSHCAKAAQDAEKEWDRAWRHFCFWDRESGIPFRFRTRTVTTWNPTTKANEEVGKVVRRYVENLDTNLATGTGFVLLGPPGVGKSHLLTAVVAESIDRGNGSYYAVWPDVVTEVKNGFSLPKCEGRRDVIALLKDARLVALDELALKQSSSEFEAGLLFELIDHRYRERLPTLVASNATRDSFPALVGERIADRLGECSPSLVLTGTSQRATRVPDSADALPQIQQPPKELVLRVHSSGKLRETTKKYKANPREF